MSVRILIGDVRAMLKTLPDESVHCVVTSPPYFGLRDYGTAQWEGGARDCGHELAVDHDPKNPAGRQQNGKPKQGEEINRKVCRCGAVRVDSQIGLESSPQEFVGTLVDVFREVRRVLRSDGTCWINMGDSYAGSWGAQGRPQGSGEIATRSVISARQINAHPRFDGKTGTVGKEWGLKPKDKMLMPHRLAIALCDDGWWVRDDIVWCLSGGTVVYVRTQKGDMPMMLKDLARLNPATVKLWNGERWTQLLGMSKSARRSTELTLVLRSGERISCTTTHKFPTSRGLLEASDIKVGDALSRVKLPQPDAPRMAQHVGEDAAWLAGLYLAEGSMSGDTIQITGHTKEEGRWERLQRIARAYGGTATRTVIGNNMNIRLYGRLLVGLVGEFVSGKTAINKHIAPAVWRYDDRFLSEYVRGYLDGDGHWDEKNQRWRLGFCRNYALDQDLRTACARLGWTLTLNPVMATFQGGKRPAFKGEMRMERSGHQNERSRNEVVRIEKGRCRWVYDLGVEDEPHLFALASGILTHNSKPNPMPESVRDRCTKAHEYIFLLAKSERYYYDFAAMQEPSSDGTHARLPGKVRPAKGAQAYLDGAEEHRTKVGLHAYAERQRAKYKTPDGWDTTKGEGGHGSFHKEGREAGHVGYEHKPSHNSAESRKARANADAKSTPTDETNGMRKLAEAGSGTKNNTSFDQAMAVMPETRNKRSVWTVATAPFAEAHFATFPPALIEPCILAGCPQGGVVLDPFAGAFTTSLVCERLQRDSIAIELNPAYVEIGKRRLLDESPMFTDIREVA